MKEKERKVKEKREKGEGKREKISGKEKETFVTGGDELNQEKMFWYSKT